MKPLETEAHTEAQPERGRKVFGQTIYVTALERGTRERSRVTPARVDPLPERIEIKICSHENNRGRLKYCRSRSIPELCRITLNPTGDKDPTQDYEPDGERKEVYISQYTHCFEGKIAKPHIAAWKQDVEQCHVAHKDSKMCVINSPVASKSRDLPKRPMSAPPGSFLFDFEKMDIQEPLSRRSTSPGMFVGDWMGIDETDYDVDDVPQKIARPQAEEKVTAQFIRPYENLSSSLWDDVFDGIDDDVKQDDVTQDDVTQDDVTHDPTEQARSLITTLRSCVKTPDTFRKTCLQPALVPQATKQNPEIEFLEPSPRTKPTPEKLSQEFLPWTELTPDKELQKPLLRTKPTPEIVSQESLPRFKPTPEIEFKKPLPRIKPKPKKKSHESLPWIKQTPEKESQEFSPWIETKAPEFEKRSETVRTHLDETAPKTTKAPKNDGKMKKEKGLTERLRDLIGDLEPNDQRVSAFKVPQATQEIKTKVDQPSAPAESWKVVEVMTSPVSPTSEARTDQSDGRVLGGQPAKSMTSPKPNMTSLKSNMTSPKSNMRSPVTSPKSTTSDRRIDQSVDKKQDITMKSKSQKFNNMVKVQKAEAEVINRRLEDNEGTRGKKAKVEKYSQPGDVLSKTTSLSNDSGIRKSSLSSEASYKRRLTSAWIEQQRHSIPKDSTENKEQRLRRTKSADLQTDVFKMDEERKEVKLKHSKSELNFEQLKAMYDPFDESDLTVNSLNRSKAKVVHANEPTVITRARSVEHKLHKITFARSLSESKSPTKSSEEDSYNEAAPSPDTEEPKLRKLQAVYTEETPELAKFEVVSNADDELKNGKKTTTDPQIIAPKITSQSRASASPPTRIQAQHVEATKIVASFSEDIPRKMSSTVVSVTANEIEGVKYQVVQDTAMAEKRPLETGKSMDDAPEKLSNGIPQHVKVQSSRYRNPVQKLTARFIKGKETSKVHHISTSTDHLDGNNNRENTPGGNRTPGSPETAVKSGGRKGAILSALKNVKIRKAKSVPNLEHKLVDLDDDKDMETKEGMRGNDNRHPLGSTPNLSPTSPGENDIKVDPNTSVETSDDTSEKRPRKSSKSALPLKISSMYPKFKKFTKKLRKTSQHGSEEADVSCGNESGLGSSREVLRSDQSTASFVSTSNQRPSEHNQSANVDLIDLAEIEEDVFAVESSPIVNSEVRRSNDNGANVERVVENTVYTNGEQEETKDRIKVTKIKVISRETRRHEDKNNTELKRNGLKPTISSSYSAPDYNNIEKPKTNVGNSAGAILSEVWLNENTNVKGPHKISNDSIVLPVRTSTSEVVSLGSNRVQHKTTEPISTVTIVSSETRLQEEAKLNGSPKRKTTQEIALSNDEQRPAKIDQLRETNTESAVVVTMVSSETRPMEDDQANNGTQDWSERTKISTVDGKTTRTIEDVISNCQADTAMENAKNKENETSKMGKNETPRTKDEVEKKEFGRKIKGFIAKVSPFNHSRGKISPQKEVPTENDETREEAMNTSRKESGPENEATVKYGSKVQYMAEHATVKTIVEREQANKFVRTRSENEKFFSIGNHTRSNKLVATVTVDPVRTTAKPRVNEERITKQQVREDVESLEAAFDFLSSAFGEDTRQKTTTTAKAVNTTAKRRMKDEIITKVEVTEDVENLESAFDFLSSTFSDDNDARQKITDGKKTTRTQVSDELVIIDAAFDFINSEMSEDKSRRQKTRVEVLVPKKDVENGGSTKKWEKGDFGKTDESKMTSGKGKDYVDAKTRGSVVTSSNHDITNNLKNGTKKEMGKMEGKRMEGGGIQGFEIANGTNDSKERRDFFTKNNERTAVREDGRSLSNEKLNKGESGYGRESYTKQIATFTTDQREHIQNFTNTRNSFESERNSMSGKSSHEPKYERMKGATINEDRHQATLVQAAPTTKSEHGPKFRSINVEREMATAKSNAVESHEGIPGSDDRGMRRGVTAFSTTQDEKKHQLQYVEKVTMTKGTVASDVRREMRGKKETGTIQTAERGEAISGEKSPGMKLEHNGFLNVGNANGQVDVRKSENWSQSRCGEKTSEMRLGHSDFLEGGKRKGQVDVRKIENRSQTRSGETSKGIRLEHTDFLYGGNTKEQVDELQNKDWSQTRSGETFPGIKLDWNDDAKKDPDFGNDSPRSGSKASSDDELLQLIEDQISASDESDDLDKSDNSEGDTTPVPKGSPEIHSTFKEIPEATKNSETEHKTTGVSPSVSLARGSIHNTDFGGTISGKTRPDPTNGHTDSLPNGNRKVEQFRYKTISGFTVLTQRATSASFVDANMVNVRNDERKRHPEISSGEVTHNTDFIRSHSYSGQNSEMNQELTTKITNNRPKHFTKKKKQTNTKSEEDFSVRLKRLLTDDSSGPDDNSINQDMTSRIYSFSEDSELDTNWRSKNNTRLGATDQRHYRSLERPNRTTKNLRMPRSSQISTSDISSEEEEYYRNRDTRDYRLHSKTL